MGTFLPEGYKPPVTNSKYLKLALGSNKVRILSSTIVGWVDWQTMQDGSRKPLRTKDKQAPINPTQPPKHFWAMVVWDYNEGGLKILEITQASIRSSILALFQNDDWGDPKGYDLTITREGEKMETKYTVMPSPKSELSQEIKEKFESTKIDLNKLYVNGDPFEDDDLNATVKAKNVQEIMNVINEEPPLPTE